MLLLRARFYLLLPWSLAGWLRVWAPHFPPLCQVLPGGPAALLHGGFRHRRSHLSQGEAWSTEPRLLPSSPTPDLEAVPGELVQTLDVEDTEGGRGDIVQ